MREAIIATLPALERDTVQVCWFATDLLPVELEQLAEVLDPEERARANRFRLPRDRGRFIAARGRLRQLLGRYAGEAPAQLKFDIGPFGKPELRRPPPAAPLGFNLSHSDGIGVLAVGPMLGLGVDVERVRPVVEARAIAERMFTAEENQALGALPIEHQLVSFFRHWTRKEAVVKSLARGLSYPNGFSLPPDSPSPTPVELESDGAVTRRWLLPLPSLRDGFVAALATTAPATIRCWNWPGE
jgi:4'-phosphopantetheinyl transferase